MKIRTELSGMEPPNLLTGSTSRNSLWLRWDVLAVVFLLGLGLVHLPFQMVSELGWDHPASFRKPILFGISTGLTLGSLLLLLNDLSPRQWDPQLRGCLCGSLVLEVALITLQAWRKTPSHFNRSTLVDATIETSMLICILLAVVIIMGLTVRTLQPNAFRPGSPTRIFAHRAGMLFLLISCLLGIGITIVGNYQILRGRSSEILGDHGVLKFPHGAVLHAIQTLVVWSWICDKLGTNRGSVSVALLAASHLFFLAYATRQTWMGHSRWDTDEVGMGLVVCAVASLFLTVATGIWPRK